VLKLAIYLSDQRVKQQFGELNHTFGEACHGLCAGKFYFKDGNYSIVIIRDEVTCNH
jgi:hypothetical protein